MTGASTKFPSDVESDLKPKVSLLATTSSRVHNSELCVGADEKKKLEASAEAAAASSSLGPEGDRAVVSKQALFF